MKLFLLKGNPLTTKTLAARASGWLLVARSHLEHNFLLWLVICLLPPFLSFTATAQTIRYVKVGGTGNGSSWETASGNLQAMIEAATGTTQIWVAKGTYTPTAFPRGCTTCGTDVRNYAFLLKNNVKLYGGFAGTETSLDSRNSEANPTILSGNTGSPDTKEDNSYHVIVSIRSSTAGIDGFTITDGNAVGNGSITVAGDIINQGMGGGMYAYNSGNYTITNCKFIANTSKSSAGMYSLDSSPQLVNCLFFRNNATQGFGGALGLTGAYSELRPLITNCTFVANFALFGGGGVITANLKPVFYNSIFWNNASSSGSDQIYVNGGSPGFAYCAIQGGYSGAGGFTILDVDPVFVDAANGNLRLQSRSPILNEGFNSATSATTDLAGNPRKFGQIDLGAYEYQGQPCTPPAIRTQPQSQAVCEGTTVQLTVEATGTNLTYNWMKEGSETQTHTASLSLNNVDTSDAGRYTVTIVGDCGTITSHRATLTVNSAPRLTSQPKAMTTCPGEAVSFNVTATGENLSYQWQKNGETISGAISSTFEIGTVTQEDAALYSVVVRNDCGNVTSEKVTLTLPAQPVINPPVLQPVASDMAQCGATVAFIATVNGASGANLRYRIGETPITSPHFFPVGTTTVTVVATSTCGTATETFPVIVEDKTPPVVAAAPVTLSLNASGQATLDLTSLSHQIRDNCRIASVTASKTVFQCSDRGENTVQLTVKDEAGNVTEQNVVVTVRDAIQPTVLTKNSTITVPPTGSVQLTAADVDGGSFDNCGISSRAVDKTTFGPSDVGTQTVTLTVTDQSGNSATATATVTILAPPTRMSVLHQNADLHQPGNNTIKPYLQLVNEGNTVVPYGDITVRYWLTVENFSPLTNLSVYWAQLGTNKVKMKYVELPQPRQGALGYIEYSFEASAGSLAPGASSGPIQNGIGKQDWTAFNEADDYSYANAGNYTKNPKITVYRNGVLVGGVEPVEVASLQSLKVSSESRSSPTTNSISTYIQLRNEGNVAVNYPDLHVRYYFTAEGGQPLNFYLDYAGLGSSKIKGTLHKLAQPVAGADSYLELSFTGLDKLYPLTSTGNIQYRIAKSDWSSFNQTNDHSYLASGPMAANPRMVVYLGSTKVYGTEPAGANARLNAEDATDFTVTVLGNPVRGLQVDVEITGAAGQPLHLLLTDVQGRVVAQKQVAGQELTGRYQLPLVSQAPGILMLRVSTANRLKILKLVKAE
ncbi:cellulose binding domain-containing protein [Larkinella insperata]|uniref:Cellulose binding domain-containing protein n=1 Tax=Larkinella insperata TaxID=332158 RepID=A0ABW3Q2M5_9BACT